MGTLARKTNPRKNFSFSFPKSLSGCFSSSSSSTPPKPTTVYHSHLDSPRRIPAMTDLRSNPGFTQNVIVMRHGDRIDNFEPLWVTTSKTPWDPPLIDAGKVRAFCTGRKLRNNLGFPIHRVIVSPFTRCIETASQAVSALAAVNDDDPLEMTSDNISIDPSKLKVSIEFGLCEILSKEAIRSDLAPKDGKWGFEYSSLEKKFPLGTVDSTTQHLYKEMPKWEEPLMEARARYARVFRALADKFPSENLLLVTHGEGVGVAISAFLKDTSVFEVEYCAFAHLQREIVSGKTGEFEVVTKNAQSGVRFCPTSSLSP